MKRKNVLSSEKFQKEIFLGSLNINRKSSNHTHGKSYFQLYFDLIMKVFQLSAHMSIPNRVNVSFTHYCWWIACCPCAVFLSLLAFTMSTFTIWYCWNFISLRIEAAGAPVLPLGFVPNNLLIKVIVGMGRCL